MASFISSPTVSTSTRSLVYPNYSPNSYSKALKFSLYPSIPNLGITQFSTWNGLKQLGPSITTISLCKERKRGLKGRMVFASLFGVGAPEALVIGVVALLVFGPKGLAEVARNLGKTLRAFQPTIRELQDVSREFKSTLEREIGLDDIPSQMQNTYSSNRPDPGSPISSEKSSTEGDPNGALSESKAYSADDYLKITEEQLKAAAIQQQGENQIESESADKETALPQKPENEV